MQLKSYAAFICVLLISCETNSPIDLQKEMKAILDLEAKNKEYHFAKDTKGLVGTFSDDFLSISKGVIDRPSYGKSLQRFSSYFSNVHFLKWDDKQEPIVRFSDDATVAYVAVDKLVITEWKNETGEIMADTTNFAWLSIYKKENGKWRLDCISSTNK